VKDSIPKLFEIKLGLGVIFFLVGLITKHLTQHFKTLLPVSRTQGVDKEGLDDNTWIEDFQKGDDNLQQTACDLVDAVDDPKLSASEVCFGCLYCF